MTQRRNRYLAAIAVLRLIKAVALFAAGVAALRLLWPAVAQRVGSWIEPVASDHAVVGRALSFVTHLSPQQAGLIAAAAFAYGAVMAAEGVGLWMQKRWGEWLTIIITASFIPFEIGDRAPRDPVTRRNARAEFGNPRLF